MYKRQLDELTARVDGSVRVRTPRLADLAAALRDQHINATVTNDHALLAHGTTSAAVGDIAFAAGIPVHELTAESSSLEEIFLNLTSAVAP